MKKTKMALIENKRATFMAKADYREGSKIDKIVKGIIDSFATSLKLDDYRF